MGVAIEEAAAGDLPGFITAFNPPFPVGYNTDQEDYSGFPAASSHASVEDAGPLVFIDGQGVVREQYEGDAPFMSEEKQELNIQHAIEGLLVGGAAGKKAAVKKPEKAS